MLKKTTYILLALIFLASCESFDSVKRGITGAKKDSADEFLVKKKDPLILPPDFENLPTPDEEIAIADENLIFEKALEAPEEEISSGSNSVESSILKKIQSK